MSSEERPLPRPPKTPFGRVKNPEEREETTLMADRIAAAIAEGRLDEFFQEEIPDNEYTRSLVSMMMGMTGMSGIMPPAQPEPEQTADNKASVADTCSSAGADTSDSVKVPEDVVNAVDSADVAGLMELLKREYLKRAQDAPPLDEMSEKTAPVISVQDQAEKEVLDSMIRISSANNVSIDWLLLRALRLYVNEYQRTGRL